MVRVDWKIDILVPKRRESFAFNQPEEFHNIPEYSNFIYFAHDSYFLFILRFGQYMVNFFAFYFSYISYISLNYNSILSKTYFYCPD